MYVQTCRPLLSWHIATRRHDNVIEFNESAFNWKSMFSSMRFVWSYQIFLFFSCLFFSFFSCSFLFLYLIRYLSSCFLLLHSYLSFFLYFSSSLNFRFVVQPFRIGDISGYEVAVVTNNDPIKAITERAEFMCVCMYSRLVQLRRSSDARFQRFSKIYS